MSLPSTQGSPHSAHSPGPHVNPPAPSAPAPVTPQQAHSLAWPLPVPVPRELPDAWGWSFPSSPQLITHGWDRPWLPAPACRILPGRCWPRQYPGREPRQGLMDLGWAEMESWAMGRVGGGWPGTARPVYWGLIGS